ncbi:DUF5133 domain-containing protein [Streptomyces sp. NPDC088847]|uniref:DUF5133 domain-containing protein n=1 Tax=Streptomyces sp. NPDC088847 TaxID=3365909 RepID=UPI0037FAD44C
MITPTPRVLRTLLAQYAEACVRVLEDDTAARQLVLRDAAHRLCVVTGTGAIQDALAAADRTLARQRSDTAARRHEEVRAQEGRSSRAPAAPAA